MSNNNGPFLQESCVGLHKKSVIHPLLHEALCSPQKGGLLVASPQHCPVWSEEQEEQVKWEAQAGSAAHCGTSSSTMYG